MITPPQAEGLGNLDISGSHFIDHDIDGHWYIIPRNLFLEWSRLVRKALFMDTDPQYDRFQLFRVKPSEVMREVYSRARDAQK